MAKTGKAPKGFYSATQVMKKLGIASSTLYHYVEIGRIKRVVPPDKRDGYYLKDEIDKMVKARELFILQYATETSTFEVAQEEDTEGIADLNAELFGGNRASKYDLRMAQYHMNPESFHVLKQDGIVVGYVGIFPLKPEVTSKILLSMGQSRFRTDVLEPEYITQFKPGEADSVFLTIGVKQNVKKSTLYGARVISGALDFLETLAKRGVFIKRAYGTSRTGEGIKLSKGLGFKQVTSVSEEDDLLRFELDLATTKSPLFKKYQELVKRATTPGTKT